MLKLKYAAVAVDGARDLLFSLLSKVGINDVTAASMAAPFSKNNVLDFSAYPRTLGALSGAAVGGLAGLAAGGKGDDDEEDGFFDKLLRVAGGAALGGIAGGAIGHAAGVSPATELENLKYERSGPARQALGLAGKLAPTFKGDHALPKNYTDNVTAPIDAGPRTALAGRVAPNQVSVLAQSPRTNNTGFLRQQFVDNKPVNVLSTDGLGLDESDHSLTGSETIGSPVGYDYNGAFRNFFNRRLPIKPTESGVNVGTHAHGGVLASTSTSSMREIVSDLGRRGILSPQTTMLAIESCNAGGANVPAIVKDALGYVPPQLQYTPPGGSNSESVNSKLDDTVKAHPEFTRRNVFQPQETTFVQDATEAEPASFRQLTQPLVPSAWSRKALKTVGSFLPSVEKALSPHLDPQRHIFTPAGETPSLQQKLPNLFAQ